MPNHHRTASANQIGSLQRQLAAIDRRIAELAQQEAGRIVALEHAEWLAAGDECRLLDKSRRNARARLTALAEGAPQRWPREMWTGVKALDALNFFQPRADATYTLLSFSSARDRLRFLRGGPAEREALLRDTLTRGGVFDRRVAEWKQLLASDPALLQTAPPGAILTWDEIPDVLALAAPKADWLVEGLLPAASVTLLAGEPGSYKTWLALALLRGVDGGGNFLGRRCAESAVLYLDRENPLRVMQERLAVLGISAPQRSRIWGAGSPTRPRRSATRACSRSPASAAR
jgi:hypothetical protein